MAVIEAAQQVGDSRRAAALAKASGQAEDIRWAATVRLEVERRESERPIYVTVVH